MRMEGENRTIVRCGLELLPHTDFVGIHALLKEAGLQGKEITSVQIGFVLAPRINAAGRMGAADVAADLLETKDPALAESLALELCALNRQRQEVEQDICADADARIGAMDPDQRHALVLGSDQWHQGVVGIVASRLSEKYAAPSFMMHLKDGIGKGSCRSYGGFNLYEALEHCADLLEGYGGHELAAGFTILEENIPQLRTRLNRYVRSATKGQPCVTSLDIDAVVGNPSALTLDELDQLSQLEPYGSGNPRPVFALLGAMVEGAQLVGQGKHLKLRLSKGLHRFDGIFFSVSPEAAALQIGDRVDVAFHLQANVFRGNTSLQMQLVDLRPSRSPSRQEAESLALLERMKAGDRLTSQERAKLQLSHQQFGTLWKTIEPTLRQGKREEAQLPLLRKLAGALGGGESFLRAAMALEVFAERKLLQMHQQGEHVTLSLVPVEGKVDLFASPYLARLQEATGTGK
ncbi:DHHA1 domain-containing protein [Bengtsoniella intestinalis]|uniref:single-stranded-DNA-specific exonuclease RecJ n=1 Tax=Bengtsoniella intestinalis TaxID=3073143 RepID=UPI00391FC476